MKLESLKLKKFQANVIDIEQMAVMGSTGSGSPCPNQQTGSGTTLHTGSDGVTSHVNFAYDVIRPRQGGITTYHGLTNVHPNGGECAVF